MNHFVSEGQEFQSGSWNYTPGPSFSGCGLGTVLTAFTLELGDFSFRRHLSARDRAMLFAWALVEKLGHRQLTVVRRLRGMWKYLRGRTG